MFVSAAFSFILYLLVFFRLRGNISLSAGNKINFHRRPKVRLGRTSDGTYIVTDDHRVESHLTRVAKHMLWYPLVYTVLVAPQAASRFSGFSGATVPFSVTISTSVLFLLHGFVNTLLFCTTRNILPGSWRQRFGLSTMGDSRKSGVDISSRTNGTWRFTGLNTRASTITVPAVLSVGVEKDVEIKYEEAQPSPSHLKFGSLSPPTSPITATSHTLLPRAHAGSGKRAGSHKHLVRDATVSICIKVDGNNDDGELSAGVDPASREKTSEPEVPLQPLSRASTRYGSGTYGPAPGLEAPALAHLFGTTRPAGIDRRQSLSSFISSLETTTDPAHLSRASGAL